jgi:adenylate kinase
MGPGAGSLFASAVKPGRCAMRYPCVLLFGAPGSGKGTQGRILANVPGFFHCACGDVFRSLDLKSELGRSFYEYSSRGELVPDEISVQLWQEWIETTVITRQLDPGRQLLVLDGIPRSVSQARIMTDRIDVQRIIHLVCLDQKKLYHRMKKRALRENRYDDASDRTIQQRMEVYEQETRPVLEFYPHELQVEIDATQTPIRVLQDVLAVLPDPAELAAPPAAMAHLNAFSR